MRVNLSFMEPFSTGFCNCSMPPTAMAGAPFWPLSFGDLAGASTDLIDGGCEERGEMCGEARGDEDATECPDEVMAGDRRPGRVANVLVFNGTDPGCILWVPRETADLTVLMMQGLVTDGK